MKKEKQNPAFSVGSLRAWLLGGAAAFAFCLLGARVTAGIFESTEKYELFLSVAALILLLLSGAVGGLVSTLLTQKSSLLHGTLAALVQFFFQFLTGLLLGNGLCSVGELALRLAAILAGGVGASQLLLMWSKGRRKRKKSSRKKGGR